MSYNGKSHTLGFKPEATEGTATATVTTFLSTEKVGMSPRRERITPKTSRGTGNRLPAIPGQIKPHGSCPFEIHASQPQPFYWALGAVASTMLAAGVYRHVITIAAAGPKPLTAEGNLVAIKAKQAGCKISKIGMKATPGEIAQGDIAWLGRSHDSDPTFTSVPVFTNDPLVVRSAGVKVDGSDDLGVTVMEWDLETGVEQVGALIAVADAPGSVRKKVEDVKASGKLTWLDYQPAAYAAMNACDTFPVEIDLVGDAIDATYNKSMKVELHCCQYTGGLDPEAGQETITGSANFEAIPDPATGDFITITVVNTIADITL